MPKTQAKTKTKTLDKRHEFIFIYDVKNGNPNGDPESGNEPRHIHGTGRGIITDVSIKRKIRNYVANTREAKFGSRIYIAENAVLNDIHKEAYDSIGKKDANVESARKLMCDNFFDVRTFGAVMSTGKHSCGKVRGPVQITMSESIDPITPLDVTITRSASADVKGKVNQSIGRKFVVPYGLYMGRGFISAFDAHRTGFSTDDMDLLFEGMMNMFEHDRSSGRGEMTMRKIIIFEHSSALGNAPAGMLFDNVSVRKTCEGEASSFSDYQIEVNSKNLPVTVREMVPDGSWWTPFGKTKSVTQTLEATQ